MPTETTTEQTVFVSCNDPRCKGNQQRPIPGLRVEMSWTYRERDPEYPLPGVVEDSRVYFKAANDEDNLCRVCEGTVNITDQPRTPYPNISGHPASESLKHFGSYKPDKTRSAEVDAVLERLADVIANG